MKIKVTDIEATGTPGNTTYLRGDGVWEVPPGGGGGGGGAPWYFNPPSASSFTLGNFGGSNLVLTDDADAGLLVDSVDTLFPRVRFAERPLTDPTLDWEVSMRFSLTMFAGSDMGFGIYVRDASGNSGCYTLRGNENYLYIRRNSTGGIAGTAGVVAGGSTENSPVTWLRLRRTGTNVQAFISNNGKLWVPVSGSQVINGALTPGNPVAVGFGIEHNGAAMEYRTVAAIENFTLTGPAV